MKKIYLAALLALPLLATPSQATGFSFGFSFADGPFLRIGRFPPSCGGCGPATLGPWYNYWPLEAHFTQPAPTGYPYWPQPQAYYQGQGYAAPSYPAAELAYPGPQAYPAAQPAYAKAPQAYPAAQPAYAAAQQRNPAVPVSRPKTQAGPELNPVGYQYTTPYAYPGSFYGAAPSYWYSRP